MKKISRHFLVLNFLFTFSCATRASLSTDRSPSTSDQKNLLQKIFRDFSKSNKTIGAAAVFVHANGKFETAEYGTTDNNKTPFSKSTKTPIGSLTKSFTGLWFLKTQNKHGILLSDSVGSHNLQISDFFAHSAGLQPNLYNGMYDLSCENPRLSSDQLRPFINTSSKKQFRYSNLGYEIVASLASEKMGEPFESSMLTELKKIGLKNPQWFSCHHDTIPGFSGGKIAKTAYLRDLAAGGLNLSIDDLKIYIESLLKNRTSSGESLLPDHQWANLFTNHIPATAESYGLRYGMGWNLNGIGSIDGNEIFWHAGATPPYQAYVAIIPKLQMGFAFISNTHESTNQIYPFVRNVFELMSGRKVQIEKHLSLPIDTKEWTGNYSGMGDNLFKIKTSGDSLTTEYLNQKIIIEKSHDILLPFISKFWGLIKVGLGDDLYLTAEQNKITGEKAIVLRGFGQPLPFRKLDLAPRFPPSWEPHLGLYHIVPQAVGGSQALFLIYKVQLYRENSQLMAKLFIKNPTFDNEFEMVTPFLIVSDSAAVSHSDNYLLTLKEDEMQLSGFSFRKEK